LKNGSIILAKLLPNGTVAVLKQMNDPFPDVADPKLHAEKLKETDAEVSKLWH
jgi:hypothetical protein